MLGGRSSTVAHCLLLPCSDIFLGERSALFRRASAQFFLLPTQRVKDHCLSVIGSDGQALHLEARTAEDRQVFLRALILLLKEKDFRTVDREEDEAEEDGAALNTDDIVPATGVYHFSSLLSPGLPLPVTSLPVSQPYSYATLPPIASRFYF